jgi:hypothetical protein
LESSRVSYYHRSTVKRGAASHGTKGQTPSAVGEIEAGARIVHAQFGKGSVLEVSGGIAVIKFNDGKVMKFMLRYTPIRKDNDYGH